MSSSSPLGTISGGIGHGIRRGFPEGSNTPFLKDTQNRYLLINEYEELYSSEIEFLEHQKIETDNTYQKWVKIYLLTNLVGIIYNLGFAIAWFRWVLDINSDDYVCVELKRSIAWISIGYLIDIFIQSASVVAAYTKTVIVLLIYEGLLLGIFIWRIFLDVSTINTAAKSLAGCARTASEDLSHYIIGTIAYGAIIITLFALTIKLLQILYKSQKARNLCEDYKMKKQRQISRYV